ncbi:MAG: SH3 domain-containing protein [bacterium]|nr:SH3 domain-containing protein [bacterium]
MIGTRWFFLGLFVANLFLTTFIQADTGLPVPRFVSARSGKVNARVGPSKRYPVEWVFVQPEQPFEVLQEHENWRRVRNHEGHEGWVHQSTLSGLRTIVVKGKDLRNFYKKPDLETNVAAKAEPNVIGRLIGFEGSWCRVKIGDLKAWILRDHVWGVYASER